MYMFGSVHSEDLTANKITGMEATPKVESDNVSVFALTVNDNALVDKVLKVVGLADVKDQNECQISY